MASAEEFRGATKILVTGGAGFIGSHVVRILLERYSVPVRVMHLPHDNMINLKNLDVELFSGDITSAEDVSTAVAGCDVVFHLAAVYALWLPDMTLMDRVNVGGTRLLFEECVKQGVERVVYTSSFARFAGQGLDATCDETSPFKLNCSYYSRTKYESHQMAERYAKNGLDVVIVNPACPLGPGDYGPTPTGRLIADAFSLPVTMGVHTISNYIDVRDCAMGHVLALEKGRTGESYILGDKNASHPDLMRSLQKVVGLKRPLITVSPNALYPVAYLSQAIAKYVTHKAPFMTPVELEISNVGLIADPSRAKNELGLPSRPIEQTLRDAVSWFVQNGYITNKEVCRKFEQEDGVLV
ncbi:hypothetical protein A9Q81_06990 [Gammaproteobacteria bacterium 42_54_T18]|nr:hypothetical protein A9Q81_06990 [Gammaproteobacteria bacterium 42_54_T18]